jgi:hypothetical protein
MTLATAKFPYNSTNQNPPHQKSHPQQNAGGGSNHHINLLKAMILDLLEVI